MFKKEVKGYFSVEASFLMPLIILVLWFLIFMGLYLYNVCTMYRISFSTCVQGVNKKRESKVQIEEEAKEQLGMMTQEELLMMENIGYQVKVNNKEIQIELSGEIKTPVFALLSSMADLWEIRVSCVRSRENPVEFVRNLR